MEVLVKGLQIGLQAMLAWQDYQSNLLALQQQRAAEGRSITQEDVDAELAKTTARLAENRATLEAAAAAEKQSLGG